MIHTPTILAQTRPFFAQILIKACTLSCFVGFTKIPKFFVLGQSSLLASFVPLSSLKSIGFFLSNDIRTGTLDPKITDPSVREAVMKILEPNPKLADFIEAECGKDSWSGIITRLWPNTKYIDVIVTGTMSQYIPTLEYYSNSLPLVCTMYASSECYFGLNLNPLCKPSDVSYTLIPTMCYYEFLPVNRKNGFNESFSKPVSLNENENQDLVDLVDVKLGQEYELVVTTYAGITILGLFIFYINNATDM
jgi:hypothetical protein